MTLTAKFTLSIVAQQSSALDLTSPEADVAKSYTDSFANGTGANQAQEIFSDSRTITGSGTDNLDLSGTLTDALGATVAFTGVKAIVIRNTGTVQIRVGKKISNGFAGPYDQTAGALGHIVEPGGTYFVSNPSAAGWAVTAATADLLSVENLSASAAAYDVIIVGK
jgi:hypothetical protein